MHIFDHIDPVTLDRRDWHLWLLAIAMILILATSVAMLMYPAVFATPIALTGPYFRRIFVSFCVLSCLVVGYLIDRHLIIRQLRKRLGEEQKRILLVRQEASVDLLESLPRFEHFQDRLAMEFRRATNLQQPLSLVIACLKPSRSLTDQGEISAAFGDAAKALVRKLRGEDSIYLFAPGVFGAVLPGVPGVDARCVADRLADGLHDASGASDRFSAVLRVINYPEHTNSAHEMEHMARQAFSETRPEPVEA